MRRYPTRRVIFTVTLIGLMSIAPSAMACGFLVSPNGATRLLQTTTFASWEDGVEHYVTNFAFEGEVSSFGSIIPLPGEPSDVRRAGDWTLQRLVEEVSPPPASTAADFSAVATMDAEVLFRTQIDSLDVAVLRGGGPAVLEWVNSNGFNLPPGEATQHMLDFYASRSPYFMAARFDAEAAAQDGFTAGDGIPVQITVPTARPWVPLHILHGASPDTAVISADVFLLTPDRPDLLYGEGLTVENSGPATELLLDDLRSDQNMEWIPEHGWLTYLRLDTAAENVVYDLSVGVDQAGPSFVDAGLTRFEPTPRQLESFGLEAQRPWGVILMAASGLAMVAGVIGGLVASRRR